MREKISTLLKESIKTCSEKALLANLRDFHGPIELDITKDPSFGDYASNLAIALAAIVRDKPRKIAQVLAAVAQRPIRAQSPIGEAIDRSV